ncbi:MAG: hypothetical protein MH321_00965 [Leptospiraceae bacterium]|nr:hypothetical protein [Leptospiraceae bacterium]
MKKILFISFIILFHVSCASERKVCYEEYGVSSFDSRRNLCWIIVYGLNEDSKNQSLSEEQRESARLTAERGLNLCYYGLVAEADCNKESDTKLSPKFRNPLW